MASRSSKVDDQAARAASMTVVVAPAVGDGGEAGVVDEVGALHGPAVALEGAVAGRMAGDHHPVALGGGEHGVVAGEEAGHVVVAGELEVVAQLPVHVLVHAQEGLGHRQLDPLALPGPLPVVERGEDARHRFEAGVHVAVGERVVGVLAVSGLPLQPRDPGLGADHRGVGAPARPRPGVAVPRDRAVHEPGVPGARGRRARARGGPSRRAGSSPGRRRPCRPARAGASRPRASSGRGRGSASRSSAG